MNYYILLTSLSVSIDSFFCGFSLSASTKKRFPIILTVFLTVLVMCFFSTLLVSFMGGILEFGDLIGGIILCLVGIAGLIKKDDGGVVKNAFLTGFAVGLDGSAASLSLAVMGYSKITVPIIIAVMHFFAISIGSFLAPKRNTKFALITEKFSPLILVLLGGYKILCFFSVV